MITADFFRGNRARLGQALGGGLIALTAYSRMQRSNDSAFAFEQEANFWYLTGIEEPDWKLLYDGTSHKSWLIMPEINNVHRVFDGALSAEEAKQISGVDTVVGHDELLGLYRRLARTHSMAYVVSQPKHSNHFNFSLNPSLHAHVSQVERNFSKVQSANKELANLRAIKQPQEVTAIKAAVKTTVEGFQKIREQMASFKNEYEIESELTYYFRRHGAKGHAYDPIIAAGKNACTLHYSKNESPIRTKQLVLMDVGARKGGYAADITRTYAKGEPTSRQRQVHQAVEQAHKQIVELLRPELTIEDYQRAVDEILFSALSSLELSAQNKDELISRYMPHAVSHGLGIDVHDLLGSSRYLQPGIVMTVEPGIYIPEESIGVRIEDDILITETGNTNLSASLSTGLS